MNAFAESTPLLLLSLDTLLETSPDMIFVKDINLRYVGGSDTMARMLGLNSRKQLVGKTDFDLFDNDLASRYVLDDHALLSSRKHIIDHMEPLPDRDGRKRYSSTSKYILCDNNGLPLGLLGVARDITAQVELDNELLCRVKLERQATVDDLTGLLNRASVIERIEDCISGYGAAGMHALLFVDLDYFKQVNDCLGHPAGDDILRCVSKILGKLFEGDIIGRVGGDEFLVMLRDIASPEDAVAKANRIYEHVPFFEHGAPYNLRVTCSVGISLYQNDDKTLDQLYTEADQAMYKAKEYGKSCVVVYST